MLTPLPLGAMVRCLQLTSRLLLLLLLLLSNAAGIITTPLPLGTIVRSLLLTSRSLLLLLLLSRRRHHHHSPATGCRGHAGPGWRHAYQDAHLC
jgi:hypothetical protein